MTGVVPKGSLPALLLVLLASACPPVPQAPEVVADARDDDGVGPVALRGAEGGTVLVYFRDANRYEPFVLDVEVQDEVRIGPLPGLAVDLEAVELPRARLPEDVVGALGDILSGAEEDENGDLRLSEEQRARLRLALDLEDEEGSRVVLITQEEEAGGPVAVVRVYDGLGRLRSARRIAGRFVRATYNESTGQKTVFVERDGERHWAVFDLLEGELLGESRVGLGAGTEAVEVEVFGEGITVVVERVLGEAVVVVRLLGLDGREIAVLRVPGRFVTALTNGEDLKAFVFEFEGEVYQDLARVTSGQRLIAPDAQGLPQNPIRGRHRHLQHDRVGGEDRFVEVVQNDERGETVVRILDGRGREVARRVFVGTFRDLLLRGDEKFLAVERPGETDLQAVDLITGDARLVGQQAGAFVRLGLDREADELELVTLGRTGRFPVAP